MFLRTRRLPECGQSLESGDNEASLNADGHHRVPARSVHLLSELVDHDLSAASSCERRQKGSIGSSFLGQSQGAITMMPRISATISGHTAKLESLDLIASYGHPS